MTKHYTNYLPVRQSRRLGCAVGAGPDATSFRPSPMVTTEKPTLVTRSSDCVRKVVTQNPETFQLLEKWECDSARSPPTPKFRNATRLSPSLRCNSMIQLNASPFPAVLLEPRHATIKDGSATAGGGSAWCEVFCGLIICFQHIEHK